MMMGFALAQTYIDLFWALREHAQAQSVPKYLNALSFPYDRVMFYGERA